MTQFVKKKLQNLEIFRKYKFKNKSYKSDLFTHKSWVNFFYTLSPRFDNEIFLKLFKYMFCVCKMIISLVLVIILKNLLKW